MIYILIAVLLSGVIANILKFSHSKNTNVSVIFWGNYFFAFLFSLLLLKKDNLSYGSVNEVYTGAVTGFFFLLNFFLYTWNIKKNGLSLSVSTMRMSVLIPVLISLLLFGENITVFKAIGIFFIVIAFYLLGKKGSVNSYMWLIVLFFTTGSTDTCLKFYDFKFGNNTSAFLMYTFLFATLFNTGILIYQKKKIDLRSLLFGIVLGIPNQLTSLFFMKALEKIPACVVYPLFAANVVLVSILSDIIIWKQKFSFEQKLCFSVMIIGIIFINLNI